MAENRFTDMLKNVAEPPSPSSKSKRRPIDFGASVERDDKVVSTFQRLHQVIPSPTEDNNIKPANEPTIESAKESGIELTIEPTKVVESANEPDYKPVYESANRSAYESAIKPSLESAIESGIEPANKPTKPIDPELWFPFTEKQGRVLLYLIEAGGFANRQNIALDINVNVATVKYTLRLLAKDEYIGNIRICMSPRQGFSYNINPQKCNEFYERIKGYSANKPTHWPTIKPTHVSFSQSANDPFISSSSIKTNTTILSVPEMLYWADIGLQDRHAMTWSKEFDITTEELRQQLAWARWDIIENRKGETVENPVNWFYGVLRRTGGCYQRPENYLSPAERRLRDIEAESKRLEETRQKLQQAELDLEFQQILEDPGGDEYQHLFAQLTDFEKQQKGKVLEMGLRRIFQARKEQVG